MNLAATLVGSSGDCMKQQVPALRHKTCRTFQHARSSRPLANAFESSAFALCSQVAVSRF
jgi:hypothetical protein